MASSAGEGSGCQALFDRPVFYADGLRFLCQGCGSCCTGAPGIVRLTPGELGRLAAHLGHNAGSVAAQYLRRVDGQWRVRERKNGDCAFYQAGKGCRVYPLRPLQCRTFPFWFENLRNEERWQWVAQVCPGVGQGPLYGRETIIHLVQLGLGDGGQSEAGSQVPSPV